MLMALLLFAWTWDRVVTDCQGKAETTSHYYFQATMRETGLVPCPTGQIGLTGSCSTTFAAAPVPFGPNIWDPGTGTTVGTWVDPVKYPTLLPQPPVGGLAAWPWRTADNPSPVVSVDRAGNHCTEACQ